VGWAGLEFYLGLSRVVDILFDISVMGVDMDMDIWKYS